MWAHELLAPEAFPEFCVGGKCVHFLPDGLCLLWIFLSPRHLFGLGMHRGSQEVKCDSRPFLLWQVGPEVGLWLSGEASFSLPLTPHLGEHSWVATAQNECLQLVIGLGTLSDHLKKSRYYEDTAGLEPKLGRWEDTKAILGIRYFLPCLSFSLSTLHPMSASFYLSV